jgi:hypothetical protein
MGGAGSMQVKHSEETGNPAFEGLLDCFNENEDFKQFFKLFHESTPGRRRAAALEMKQIALRQHQHRMVQWVLPIVIQLSHIDVDRLMWPCSPLLVLLECMAECIPTVPLGSIHQPLWFIWLANLTHPDGHHVCYTRQILLAKQLVEYRVVDVNVGLQDGTTPLHYACSAGVINLEFIEFLLQSGADPNARHHMGATPLIWTTDWAPAAAKVLIEWPATDVNIVTSLSGKSILAFVRMAKRNFSGTTDNPTAEDGFSSSSGLKSKRC